MPRAEPPEPAGQGTVGNAMLNDSDIPPDRHARVLAAGLLAGLMGHVEDHGPDEGGLAASLVRKE
jgi:hypothetical protein